ncbi:hypothetical protein [Nocardia sp. NPDC050710]|uniref:hypothetical protein n=1 Tax=Nocardia sp. NPDC050710 TaxID=3157220 RepID=UPI0033EF886A
MTEDPDYRRALPAPQSPSLPAVNSPLVTPSAMVYATSEDASRVYPARYAYRWSDTTTGVVRTVAAISRDDAYESATGIRRIQRRRHRRPAVVVSGLEDGRWMPGDITPPSATGVNTVFDVDIVAEICREILQDIADGVIPADVSSFSDLHDHIDASQYADQHISAREDLSGQTFVEFIVDVQDVVTAWLQAGRPPTFVVTAPVGPAIVQLHTPTTYPDADNELESTPSLAAQADPSRLPALPTPHFRAQADPDQRS